LHVGNDIHVKEGAMQYGLLVRKDGVEFKVRSWEKKWNWKEVVCAAGIVVVCVVAGAFFH